MTTRPCYFCRGKGRRRLRRRARGRGRGGCYGPCTKCGGTGRWQNGPPVVISITVDELRPDILRTFLYGNSPHAWGYE